MSFWFFEGFSAQNFLLTTTEKGKLLDTGKMLPFLKTNFVELYDCYVKIIQNWIWLFTELDASKVIQTVNLIENIKLHWFLVKIFGINLFSHPWKLYHRTFLFIIFYLQVVGFILHCGFGHLSPYLIAIRHQTLVFRTHFYWLMSSILC